MMKSFFKKLASVLALAMVVSLAAPAAQTAQAAEAKKFTYHYSNGGSAVTTVNLAKTGDTVDLNFVGIKDYKDYKTLWVSTGEGFTVDQSGVLTATADSGSGLVWLSVGDDQTYVSDPVKVTIGEYKNVTIGSQDKSNRDLGAVELKVGQSMDLAFFGILDWNLGKYTYKWVPADSSIISVDQKTGEITALKAGETTLTFMALNKYNYTNGITTKPLTVTVKPAKTTFVVDNGTTNVNTTEDDIDVYFSEAVTLDLEKGDVELYRVFEADDDNAASGLVTEYKNNYAYESKYVTGIYEDSKNKMHWTIEPYEDLIDGETYEIRVKDLEPVQFTASVGAVVKVEVVEVREAVLAEEYEASVSAVLGVDLYDAKGVLVDDAKYNGKENDSEEFITFTVENEEDGFFLTVDEIEFFENVPAKIVATYDNGKNVVASAAKTIRPNARGEYGIKEIVAWTIINENLNPWDAGYNIDWKNTTQEMAANDTYRKLVVLFRDTRGQLYTTDFRGVNDSYNKEEILLTLTSEEANVYEEFLYNAEGTPFAANGCYVEFKAMDPDNLLIDVDGGIESYKKTNTRWGLYLYNYRLEDTQFDKEVFSATIKVNAPRVMKKIEANNNNHSILLFTEQEQNGWSNAYYSQFSVGWVHFDLFDQYNASWSVDKDNVGTTVEDPYFEVTNLTNHSNAAALNDVFERYEKALNDELDVYYPDSNDGGSVRDASLYFELNDFINPAIVDDVNNDTSVNLADKLIAGKTITFRVTEKVSGFSEKIVITIIEPNEYIKDNAGDKIPQDNAVVREERIVREIVAGENVDTYEELFDIAEGDKTTVDTKVTHLWNRKNTKSSTTKYLTLTQKDAKGYTIGYENNIVISKVKPVTNNALKKYYIPYGQVFTVDNANGQFTKLDGVDTTAVAVGTKVIVVTMPNGDLLNYVDIGNKNAAWSAKEEKVYGAFDGVNADTAAPATASALGISFNTKSATAQDGTTTTYYNQYKFNFATIDNATKEMYFLPFGTYTATVYTVDGFLYDGDVNKDGKVNNGEVWDTNVITDVVFSGNSLFKQTYKFNFTDDMPEVVLNKRINATTSVYLGAVDPELHDEEYVKELIVDNFTFKWNGGLFDGNEDDWKGIDTDDILCYTVQKSTNNQIIIKDVVFKAWFDWDNDGDRADDFWYRSTATVNLSLTYVEEN